MKTKRLKRYGVQGYVEYVAMIPTPGGNVYVSFTGGRMTGYGVTPAQYSTCDEKMQRLIESSDLFLAGKIHLIKP